MPAISLASLHAQLESMQMCLHTGELQDMQRVLDQYSSDLHDLLQKSGFAADKASLSQLLQMQLQVQEQVIQAHQVAHQRWCEFQQAGCAARAYLAMPDA